MIKAIFIDFDGVIRHWPNDDSTLEKRFSLPPGLITIYAFEPNILSPAIRGEISDHQWRQLIADRLASDFPTSNIQGAIAEWSTSCGVIDMKMIQLLETYQNYLQVLTTNATSRLNSDLNQLKLTDFFSAVINSSDIGAIKPEPEFFRKALDTLKLRADEVVFVDDTPENTATAINLGIISHTYSNLTGLQRFFDATLK